MKRIFSFIIVLVMMLSMIPAAHAEDYYFDDYIYENSILTDIVFDRLHPYYMYSFMPDESGYYRVISLGYEDTYAFCHDENSEEVAFDDDSGEGENFNCVFYAQAFKQYIVTVGAYNTDNTETEIFVQRLDKKEPQKINVDDEFEVQLKTVDRSRYYEFVPQESDYYAFYTLGDEDTQAYMYDDSFNVIDEDADSGEKYNCYLSHYLEKGKKYYFELTNPLPFNYSGRMTIKAGLRKTAVVEEINIIKNPDKMSYYKEFVESVSPYVRFRGLECELVFTDGRKEIYKYESLDEIVGATVETGLAQKDDGTYFYYVMAGYGYTEIYPQVKDATVTGLTLNTAPDREYVFSNGAFGNTQTDRYGNQTYNFRPHDLKGLSFDVNFSDGTSVTYTSDDIEKGFDRIDGYTYNIEWIPVSEHEVKGGKTFEATVNFLGHSIRYDVFMYDSIKTRGDVDMDGTLTILDATKIQKYLVGLDTLNEAQIYAGNVYYNDSKLDIIDATKIQQHLASLWVIPS